MEADGYSKDDESDVSLVGGKDSDGGFSSPFRVNDIAFNKYVKDKPSYGERCSGKSGGLKLISKLTRDIVETYKRCNPNFKHSEELNPKKYLTSPHVGVSNDAFDNTNSDLILSYNFVLINMKTQQRYIVKEMLGQGTFGQVAKCWVPETNTHVAVKVIKNQPAYYNQAIHEVNILGMLNGNFDCDNKHHIVRMHEFFVYRNHLCISFEMLGSNLYEVLKLKNLKGLPLNIVQFFSKQILCALVVMKDAGIIHCDLKPENILIWAGIKPPGIKVIDFGSACKEGHTVYSYIQSRFYRSPEALLGYPYTTAIDMWSFGCIVVELFLGLPLFAGASEYDLLRRMIEVLGFQPPDIVLRDAKKTATFFKHVGSIHHLGDSQYSHRNNSAYCLLTEEEYESREKTKPVIGKWYFNHVKLEDIVAGYPYRRNLSEEEKSKERLIRLALLDFVRGLIEFDPKKRWTPLQASGHPFVTGKPFTQPYCPSPVTYNNPIIPNIRVDHGPDQGHWLAAGLSPQVSYMNRGIQHSSPHIHMTPLSHAAGYGSWGSHGSYGDNPYTLGSYGDNSKVHDYYSASGSSSLNIPMHIGGRGSSLGANSDGRGGLPLYSYNNTGFGLSPTGTFRPMSLGVSPSQFSPGKYGPTSPAKGNSHGYPLGKTTAVGTGQYHKRNWGHPGTVPSQYLEDASQYRHVRHLDGNHSEQNPQGFIGSFCGTNVSTQSNLWKETGWNGYPSGNPLPNRQNARLLHLGNANEALHSPGSSSHQECSSTPLYPGDWDPNYSDDLLLEEDGTNINNLVSGINSIHLAAEMGPKVTNIGCRGYKSGNIQDLPTSSFVSFKSRTDEQVPVYSHTKSNQFIQDIHYGYNNHPIYLPQHMHNTTSQRFPNHLAQQPANHINQVHGGRDFQNIVLTRPTYNSENPQGPPNNVFDGVAPWGQQGGHPHPTMLPQYPSSNDYGRIS